MFLNVLLLIAGFIHQVLAIFRCLCSNDIRLILSGMKKNYETSTCGSNYSFFCATFNSMLLISISHSFYNIIQKRQHWKYIPCVVVFFLLISKQQMNLFLLQTTFFLNLLGLLDAMTYSFVII